MALRTTAFLLTLNIIFFALVSADPVPQASCPVDGLKFGACTGVLNNWLNGIVVGTVPTTPCCGLFFGLINIEAATCACKAIKANVLGLNVDAAISLKLLLNNCGKDVPDESKRKPVSYFLIKDRTEVDMKIKHGFIKPDNGFPGRHVETSQNTIKVLCILKRPFAQNKGVIHKLEVRDVKIGEADFNAFKYILRFCFLDKDM
ncbi:14 kDa proline-rich protein DC2.15-like protein [Tanacetum coccineum]